VETLLYISRSNLPEASGLADVKGIVQLAQSRNQSLGITGAIVYSGPHFAQILEGRIASLASLMQSIKSDVRHRDVTIIKHAPLEKRKFAAWHMAYSGQFTYVDRHIRSLYSVPEHRNREEVRMLESLIYELVVRSPHSKRAGELDSHR
jgi:hypothetical protein